MTAPLNGGSGNSTAPKTTQNRCYQRDSVAPVPAAGGSGKGFYLRRLVCFLIGHRVALELTPAYGRYVTFCARCEGRLG